MILAIFERPIKRGDTRLLLDVKAILKPIYKRVKAFKALHDFRNEIIAHPLRRKNQFVVPQNSVYSIPRSWFEYQLLKDYVSYMFNIIKQEFESELAVALHLGMHLRETVRPVRVDFAAVNADTLNLISEVEALSKAHQRDYNVAVHTYHDRDDLVQH